MKKYGIDYLDADGEIISIEIEANDVKEHGDLLCFLDEHGEDDYVFHKEDIINYTIRGEKNE